MSLDHLRKLLHARHDLATDWEAALVAVAAQARDALSATRAALALRERDSWRVWLDSGESLGGDSVGLVLSTTVLEDVLSRPRVLRASAALANLSRSSSVDRLSVRSVLAVPLRRHGLGDRQVGAPLLGVLYLDRREESQPFEPDDEEWACDFAALAERSLSLIALLNEARRERDAARLEAVELRSQVEGGPLLDPDESRDKRYRDTVSHALRKAAQADRITLLLTGPSGVGKTHLARRFHAISRRADRPFVVFDCGQQASAESLAAELFGYAKRSGFSGSPAEGRPGKARLADGGVLFIDEVNAMPLELQQRLLRLVEAGRYSALGSAEEIAVDVQIIAATNEDLRVAVAQKRFREDLYYRLGELVLTLPSLSQRTADIVPFAERFLRAATRRFERARTPHFSADALAVLETFPWERAGNLRGLEHAVHRTVLMLEDDVDRIERDDLLLPEVLMDSSVPIPPPDGPISPAGAPASRVLTDREALRELLLSKIAEHRGILSQIALDPAVCAALGTDGKPVPASTLRLRLHRLGIENALAAERAAHQPTLEQVKAALLSHGNGRDAARALDISRHQLVWRLRQAGLSIGEVLGASREDS